MEMTLREYCQIKRETNSQYQCEFSALCMANCRYDKDLEFRAELDERWLEKDIGYFINSRYLPLDCFMQRNYLFLVKKELPFIFLPEWITELEEEYGIKAHRGGK